MWLTSERLSLIIALMSPIASGALSSSNAATSIELIKRAKHGRRRIAGRLGMLNAFARLIFPSVTKVTCPWQSSSVTPNNANSSIVHLRTLAASFRRSGSYSVVMRIRLTNASSLTFYEHLITGQFFFWFFEKFGGLLVHTCNSEQSGRRGCVDFWRQSKSSTSHRLHFPWCSAPARGRVFCGHKRHGSQCSRWLSGPGARGPPPVNCRASVPAQSERSSNRQTRHLLNHRHL